MNNKFAQCNEWDFYKQLDLDLLQKPEYQSMQQLITDLNYLHRLRSMWHQYGIRNSEFPWIRPGDADCRIFLFIRKDFDQTNILLFISIFTPMEWVDYYCGALLRDGWKFLISMQSLTVDVIAAIMMQLKWSKKCATVNLTPCLCIYDHFRYLFLSINHKNFFNKKARNYDNKRSVKECN